MRRYGAWYSQVGVYVRLYQETGQDIEGTEVKCHCRRRSNEMKKGEKLASHEYLIHIVVLNRIWHAIHDKNAKGPDRFCISSP